MNQNFEFGKILQKCGFFNHILQKKNAIFREILIKNFFKTSAARPKIIFIQNKRQILVQGHLNDLRMTCHAHTPHHLRATVINVEKCPKKLSYRLFRPFLGGF